MRLMPLFFNPIILSERSEGRGRSRGRGTRKFHSFCSQGRRGEHLYCGFGWKEWGRANRSRTGPPEALQWLSGTGTGPGCLLCQLGQGRQVCGGQGMRAREGGGGECEFSQLLRKRTESLASASKLNQDTFKNNYFTLKQAMV